MQASLEIQENYHLMICLGTHDSDLWFVISNFLEADFKFNRTGLEVSGKENGERQNFKQGSLIITAGWDCWLGDYLKSSCCDGDHILRLVFSCICPNNSFVPKPYHDFNDL